MNIKVDGDTVTITYKMGAPVPSSTGRVMLMYSTRGFVEIPGRPGEGISVNHTAKRKDWRTAAAA